METSLGKHMAVVKTQLSLSVSGWQENTEAVGTVWHGAPLLSISPGSYSERPQTSPWPPLLLQLL